MPVVGGGPILHFMSFTKKLFQFIMSLRKPIDGNYRTFSGYRSRHYCFIQIDNCSLIYLVEWVFVSESLILLWWFVYIFYLFGLICVCELLFQARPSISTGCLSKIQMLFFGVVDLCFCFSEISLGRWCFIFSGGWLHWASADCPGQILIIYLIFSRGISLL